MFEYLVNQPALLHVRLLDTWAMPITGVTFDQVTVTLEKGDGVVVNVPVDNAAGAHWTEVTTGAFAGKGKYDLTIPASYINVVGPFVYAVSGGLGESGTPGSAIGVVNVVIAKLSDVDKTNITAIKTHTDALPVDPASNTHVDQKLAILLGVREQPSVLLSSNAGSLVMTVQQVPNDPGFYVKVTEVRTGRVWDETTLGLNELVDSQFKIAMAESPTGSGVWTVTRNFSTLPNGYYDIEVFTTANISASKTKNAYLLNGVQPVDGVYGHIPVNHNSGGTDALRYLTPAGVPIGNATIRVYTATDWNAGNLASPVGVTTTDGGGRWISTVFVPPGTYAVQMQLLGQYGPDVHTIVVTPDQITTSPDDTGAIAQVPLSHDTGGTDNLAYKTPGGTPIVGASVRVFESTDWAVLNLTRPVGVTSTDENGRWAIPIFVNPGTYVIQFHVPGLYGPDSTTVTV